MSRVRAGSLAHASRTLVCSLAALLVSVHAQRLALAQPSEAPAPGVSSSSAEKPSEPVWRTDHPVDAAAISFKPGSGLNFRSRDGLFTLQLRTWGQLLYEIDDRWNKDEKKRETVGALLVRRLRLFVMGTMFSKDLQYHVQLTFAPRELGLGQGDANAKTRQDPPITNGDNVVTLAPLLNYYLQLNASRDASIRVGQYPLPYNRERITTVRDLEFVDRSLANAEFMYDRDLGFDVRSGDLLGLDQRLRYYAGISMGEGNSANNLTDFGYNYFARFEYVPIGALEDYAQADLLRRKQPALGLGAAYLFANRAKGNRGNLGHTFADAGWANYNNGTADVVFKARGLSLEAAGYIRQGTRHTGPLLGTPKDPADPSKGTIARELPRSGYGLSAQGGYLLPLIDLEIAGRYCLIEPMGTPGKSTAMDTAQELTGALSYYFQGHLLKLQGDVAHAWGPGFQNAKGAPLVELNAAGKPKGGFSAGYEMYRVQISAGF